MRTSKISIFVGVAVLALTVGLNVRHALNDYGVKTNKLHLEVLAQTSTTGGGSTTSPNYVYLEKIVSENVPASAARDSYNAGVVIDGLPIGFNWDKATNNGTTGFQLKNCKGPALARCNQNDVGMFYVGGSTT